MNTVSRIQRKLDGGHLLHNSIPRTWGGPEDGERCDACEERPHRHRIHAKLAKMLRFVGAAFLMDSDDQRLSRRARPGGRSARVISMDAARNARRGPSYGRANKILNVGEA
jgi:hypothetical protein